jgi:hypothetical protein
MDLLQVERGVSTLGQQAHFRQELDALLAVAQRNGAAQDPVLRRRLARAALGLDTLRCNALRVLALLSLLRHPAPPPLITADQTPAPGRQLASLFLQRASENLRRAQAQRVCRELPVEVGAQLRGLVRRQTQETTRGEMDRLQSRHEMQRRDQPRLAALARPERSRHDLGRIDGHQIRAPEATGHQAAPAAAQGRRTRETQACKPRPVGRYGIGIEEGEVRQDEHEVAHIGYGTEAWDSMFHRRARRSSSAATPTA